MRAQVKGANAALMRALRARLDALADEAAGLAALQSPLDLVLEDFEEAPWASLTFCGARHWVDVRIEGRSQEMDMVQEGLRRWQEQADTLLPGHFLAEMQLVETRRERMGERFVLGFRIEALTVEE
jgi:hypothetical protein